MKVRKAVMLMTAFAAFPLLMAACGGGGGGEEDGITAGDISDEQLTQMALSQSDWGDEYAALEPLEPALEDREQRAQYVSEDEAQDLERFGELKSYEEGYNREEAFEEGAGPLRVGTKVYLFESGKGASGYLEDDIADLEGEIDKEHGLTTIESVDHFAVERIGDESAGLEIGMRFVSEYGLVAVYQTIVWFREGRILGRISVMSLDNTHIRSEVSALASSLDERIRTVLVGQGPTTPVGTQ